MIPSPPQSPKFLPADNRILLVIPSYRESERLPPFLEALCAAIESAGLPVTVRPVDDGSGTSESAALKETVERLQPDHFSLSDAVLLPANRGKGGAVYAGWDSADEEDFGWLAFVDADGAVSAEECVRVLTVAAETEPEGNECLFAVRTSDAGTRVRRTPLRKILGNIFRLLVRLAFGLPVRDTQCGFKVIPKHRYQAVRPKLSEHRFVFDVELAARLIRSGCTIREFPISWEESPGTRLRLGSALRMITALIRVRWRLTISRN